MELRILVDSLVLAYLHLFFITFLNFLSAFLSPAYQSFFRVSGCQFSLGSIVLWWLYGSFSIFSGISTIVSLMIRRQFAGLRKQLNTLPLSTSDDTVSVLYPFHTILNRLSQVGRFQKCFFLEICHI